jgi:hypothetical protein
MSTELATTNNVSAALFDKLVLNQDLKTLSQTELVQYYVAVCHNVGIDPTTKPFDILELKGKKVLYPNKSCTAQLTAIHKPSVTIISKERAGDVYIVTAQVTKRDGSQVEDIGVATFPVSGAEEQANAIMKATTKAKRRALLSAFGLGMLDESEVEDIWNAKAEPVELPSAVVDTVVLDIIASLESANNVDELQAITDRIKKLSPIQKDDIRQHTQDAAVRIGCKWIGGKWIMPEVVA